MKDVYMNEYTKYVDNYVLSAKEAETIVAEIEAKAKLKTQSK